MRFAENQLQKRILPLQPPSSLFRSVCPRKEGHHALLHKQMFGHISESIHGPICPCHFDLCKNKLAIIINTQVATHNGRPFWGIW